MEKRMRGGEGYMYDCVCVCVCMSVVFMPCVCSCVCRVGVRGRVSVLASYTYYLWFSG
jgi:hypothetical protein